ncbi:kinesin-like protein kin-7d [Quercus suber]|uniref:Kinesin-like protein kin-7d n=1 Tax=Quercus suber TaxID=58331 RepID=A0AAW0LHA7_QUESU
MASSSRARSSSPFSYRKPSTPYSSTSSSSSFMSSRIVPRSCSSSASSYFNSGGGLGAGGSRSMTPSRSRSDSMYSGPRGYNGRSPVGFPSDDLIAEPLEVVRSGSGDSISVTIRFRPLSEREYQRGDEISWNLLDFDFGFWGWLIVADRVFGPQTASQEVYDVAAKPVVKAAMEGVNGTVFAYGVTSSGKTHTMHTPGREFLLRVSYLEIYNEVINDLLDPTGQNLRVREDAQGTYVEGIKEEVVLSPGHALSFIAAGEEHRHVGSNNFNLLSSRSHTIFTLMIESSAHGDEYDGVIFSQLNLIDLAGSESSKTETTGLRRKEGSYINKSLLTLGTVIGKLSEGKASHVPYRDSKLTRLLQSSLSGHGHVSLICTVTPASSNMEETHNTLKFASRAKRVEIYASRNKIIDEKSLIKKYQREISVLKQELDQLKKGMIVGVNHEEILTLRQKLEEGQVKMQSRLEEEEDAKVALMSRIQRLTKLILVSSKNTIPGYGSLLLEGENQKDSASSALAASPDVPYDFKHRRSSSKSSKWNEELSPSGSTITESTQAGELISGSKLPTGHGSMPYAFVWAKFVLLLVSSWQGGITMSDQMDLLVEQVKMLAGEIAFSTSTLKRMVEQSMNEPDSSKTQIQNLEREIQEKRRQMRALEQRIIESGEASISNSSLVEMQQTLMRLMTQCNEKGFELEIKSADNRILQEQLQNKCSENKELHEKVNILEQRLSSVDKSSMSSEQCISDDYIDELKRKIQSQVITLYFLLLYQNGLMDSKVLVVDTLASISVSAIIEHVVYVSLYILTSACNFGTHCCVCLFGQEIENEKLKLEHVQLSEENSGLRVQNQKLAEEASYAKELASAAAVELKNLAGEVTKLSLQNAKLEKELLSARELAHSRSTALQTVNGVNRKYNDGTKLGRKGRLSGRANEISGLVCDDFESWNLDPDDLKMELQARKQREAALEAALAEKEFVEEEYRKKADEAKKREEALENDLANMWVLVAKLKKEGGTIPELNTDERHGDGTDYISDPKTNEIESNTVLQERTVLDISKPADEIPKEEPLVVRLKARMQEMKEKELKYLGNGDVNSHICKCVNLVRLLVLSVQSVAQILQIDFLHLLLDTMLFKPPNEGLSSFICLLFSVQ